MPEDPKTGTNIHRLIAPDEALRLVVEHVSFGKPRVVPLDQACGLRIAQEVSADRDYPPFDRAMMDGYAIRVHDAGRQVSIIGEAAAGDFLETALRDGECCRIMTGAPCPLHSDAVVPKEDVAEHGQDRLMLPDSIQVGQHIAARGSECRTGTVVLSPGEVLTPLAIASMASFGLIEVQVVPKPSLAAITTGAELVPAECVPGPAQIRDSNGPMLLALARGVGLDAVERLHAADTVDSIVEALHRTADRDIVLLTGGVSVGRYDLVPHALKEYGAEPVFHKVLQKPGKPLLFATRPGQILFGLPGNPLAAHLCFHRYVAAAIRCMEGSVPLQQSLPGRLTGLVSAKSGRTWFIAARVQEPDDAAGGWQVQPLPGTSSADVFAAAAANAYVEIPPGGDDLPEGSDVTFTWIAGVAR